MHMIDLMKNKFVICAICIIIVSLTYIGIQKAINNYTFSNDITNEEKSDNEIIYDDKKYSENSSNIDGNSIESENVNEDINDSENAEKEKEALNKMYIYIIGEVNNPGVVLLNEGSRIVDAIEAAGGITDKANISKINLVYVLKDRYES